MPTYILLAKAQFARRIHKNVSIEGLVDKD